MQNSLQLDHKKLYFGSKYVVKVSNTFYLKANEVIKMFLAKRILSPTLNNINNDWLLNQNKILKFHLGKYEIFLVRSEVYKSSFSEY